MSASVIPLESRRRRPQEAAACEFCTRSHNGGCIPHRLEALAHRLSLALDATTGELLVDRDVLADVVADARSVLDPITRECLTPDERNTR